MNCAEFKENVAAFALDALEPEERAACEAHLASTATHDGCLEELRRATETAAALGESLPPVRPPDRVWDAIASEVLGKASVADAPANPTDPPARSRMHSVYRAHRPVAERHAGTPRSRARFWREGVAWGLAAAAALAVVFVSARHRTIHEHLGRAQHELGLSRGQLAETLARLERIEGERGVRIRTIDAEREACLEDLATARISLAEKEALLDLLGAPDTQLIHLTAQGEVSSRASALLNSAREQAILLTSALEPQPGKDYQLWLIRGDRKISAGLLPVDASGLPILTRIAPDLLADGTPDALAITVEPAGGMPQPTGPIVLVGSAKASSVSPAPMGMRRPGGSAVEAVPMRQRPLLALSLGLNAVGLLAVVTAVWVAMQRRAEIAAFVHEPARQRLLSFFAANPIQPGDVVLLGDSLIAEARWSELLPLPVRERGVPGDTTGRILERLEEITAGRPAHVVLLVGTNDLARGEPVAAIAARYREILVRLRSASPRTRVHALSVLPREAARRAQVEALNQEIARAAEQQGAEFLDLYPLFLAPDGSIRDELSNDELHLLGPGYALWSDTLRSSLLPANPDQSQLGSSVPEKLATQ